MNAFRKGELVRPVEYADAIWPKLTKIGMLLGVTNGFTIVWVTNDGTLSLECVYTNLFFQKLED